MASKIWRWFKKYFIPHGHNEHQPYFLRVEATLAILSLILFLEIAFLVQSFVILPFSDFFAAVFPQALVDLSNQNRQKDSLGELQPNFLLQKAAQMKADDMAAKSYFSHDSPDGATPWDWFEKAGYGFTYAGENLAVNFFDSNDVVDAWMASPGHRANILNKNYTEIGIGMSKGMYQGREAVFIVQMFGSPAVALAAPADVFSPQIIPQTQASSVSPSVSRNPAPKTANLVPAEKPAPIPEKPKVSAAVSSSAPVLAKEGIFNQPADANISRTAKILAPFSAPRKSINYIFVVLATIIFLSLVLKIFIRISVQYHSLIINGVVLLLIIAGALVVNQYLLVSRAAVF